ncbi:hypothetical protein Tco_1024784 [Tanacetum coccineum]
MTDYSLWEVIKNGNKVLKRTVGETEQEYEPTTAEEKQDRRNEMKARGTLLMALPNKDQLKFHSYKDAKLLMEAIKKSNSNSSTNEADNTAFGVSAAHTQSNPTSGDNLSDAVICAFLANGIGGYDWSYQAEKELPTNYALIKFTSSGSSSSSDSEVDSYSKSRVKAYATLKEQYDSFSSDYKKSQFNLVSYKAGLRSVEDRLEHSKKNEAVFEESINVLKLKVRLRDNALVEYKMKWEKAEKERDQLQQTLEKFQNSSKSLNDLLESQVIDKFKTGLGYSAATAASPIVESFLNLSDTAGSDKGYHSVPPPLTRNHKGLGEIKGNGIIKSPNS